MLFNLGLLTTLLALASASPLTSSTEPLAKRNSDITRLGSVGKVLSGGTKFGNLVFVSGQVPLVNNTIVSGGIKNETAVCIQKVADVLKEAGTDWSRVLKVTVLMQDINDFAMMNEVYSSMIPDPKPARSAFEVGNLPVA
ncbi:hypothetical protein QFC22_001246 [Naganishia vaughanmartiniae]|uniref:Uncharacterized protein n=1 Tax=Naganishia vaughanmartiniae TaxID=1424756 RepID=A0ACC2XIF4_9TREE|nr:hypothetical protein QFC22_001246 [Naganishia vaughanmartiniae]